MQKWVRARWNFTGDAAHLENVCALQVLLVAVKPAAQGCSARPYGATDGKKPIEIVDARVDAILLNLPVAATCQRAAHLGRSDEVKTLEHVEAPTVGKRGNIDAEMGKRVATADGARHHRRRHRARREKQHVAKDVCTQEDSAVMDASRRRGGPQPTCEGILPRAPRVSLPKFGVIGLHWSLPVFARSAGAGSAWSRERLGERARGHTQQRDRISTHRHTRGHRLPIAAIIIIMSSDSEPDEVPTRTGTTNGR